MWYLPRSYCIFWHWIGQYFKNFVSRFPVHKQLFFFEIQTNLACVSTIKFINLVVSFTVMLTKSSNWHLLPGYSATLLHLFITCHTFNGAINMSTLPTRGLLFACTAWHAMHVTLTRSLRSWCLPIITFVLCRLTCQDEGTVIGWNFQQVSDH